MPRRGLVLAVIAIAVVAGVSIVGYSYYVTNRTPAPASLIQTFGTNYQSENLTFNQLPVGGRTILAGVNFTRVPYTGIPNYPAGFNMTFAYDSTGVGTLTAPFYPNHDAIYAVSSNAAWAIGYVVYPDQGIVELLVKV